MNKKRWDVIIVLGGRPSPDGKRVPATDRRVCHGVELFQEGAANFLLMSGGRNGCSTPEAVLMSELAMQEGVPEESIILESKSTRTIENAFYSKAIMKKKGWAHALVVTDGFHLPRALFTFRCFGIKVAGSSPANSWGAMTFNKRIRISVREVIGLFLYATYFLFGQAKRIAVGPSENDAIFTRDGSQKKEGTHF